MIHVAVAECEVPAIRIIVEIVRHLHGVDLGVEHDVRLDDEVTGTSQHATEARVLHVTADLVRVLRARLAIGSSEKPA